VTEARRKALVTGASRGIGAAIAQRLAADGLEVVTLDLREGCDIALDVARDEFPPLDDVDVCVANAGLTTTIAPRPPHDRRAMAARHRRQPHGRLSHGSGVPRRHARARLRRIVVISSVAAIAGLPGQVAYAASKAGQLGMVRTLAGENAGHGITVNAILPGLVATEQVLAMPADVRERASSSLPSGRMVTPAEIAAAVAFLAGEDAAQVNGQTIAVDGAASLSQLTLGSERR